MAIRKNPRIGTSNLLTELNSILSGTIYRSEILDFVEKGDTSGLENFLKSVLPSEEDRVSTQASLVSIMDKLPSRSNALRSVIEELKNDDDLTDEQIREKVSAFEELGKTSETRPANDISQYFVNQSNRCRFSILQ